MATPSVEVEEHGGVGHGRSLPDPGPPERQPLRQRVTKRSAPWASRSASLVEEVGGGRPGPVGRQQLRRQAGVGEEELAPLVHEVEARGERRLVGVVVPVGVGDDELGRGGQPRVVRRAEGVEVPGRGGRGVDRRWRGRCGPRRPRPRAPTSSSARSCGLIQTSGASSAYPRKPRSARSRSRSARCGGRVDQHQLPGAVPGGSLAAVDAGGGLVEPSDGARGQRGSRGRRRAARGRASPGRPSARSRCARRARRCRAASRIRTSAATGAWSPRARRWSPYTSKRADRARTAAVCRTSVGTRCAPCGRYHGPMGDNGLHTRGGRRLVAEEAPVASGSHRRREVCAWRR